jgi:hypothetical protein|tara:strand:+ start:896 stop:1618 length:723 start_codon:yes stop_codon:yes gene_type:complete
MTSGFELFENYNGFITTDEDGTNIYGWENLSQKSIESTIHINGGGLYGYVDKGQILIKDEDKEFILNEGEWFTTRHNASIDIISSTYRFCAWQKEGYLGVMSKGLVEDFGRLKYIDGCKDSILSNPIKMGLPCMNALYMPEGVNQTMHTHPSTRSGFIFKGGAKCETPEETYDLNAGQIFFLKKGTKHKFRSDHGKDITMKLVAFHPDSDFGPTDENHPMLNKTIVNGISASKLDNIRTK